VEFPDTASRSRIDVTGGKDMSRGGDVGDAVGTIGTGAVVAIVGAPVIWVEEVGLAAGEMATDGEPVLSDKLGDAVGKVVVGMVVVGAGAVGAGAVVVGAGEVDSFWSLDGAGRFAYATPNPIARGEHTKTKTRTPICIALRRRYSLRVSVPPGTEPSDSDGSSKDRGDLN
jgi:hypothetical protein